MKWASDKAKEVAVELGYMVTGAGRDARAVRITFSEKDTEHLSPKQVSVRPASDLEVKLWRALLRKA